MNLLIESALDVAVVLLVALAAMPLLRRQSAALRHLVLSASLLSAALLPLAAPLLPAWRVPISIPTPAVVSFTGTIAPSTSATAPTAGQPPSTTTSATPSTNWLTFAIWVWALGAVAGIGSLAAGFMRLLRLSVNARPFASDEWGACAEAVRREIGLSRPVTLLECSDPGLLVVWGALRPRVLLPRAARHWSALRMRIVLYHELSHIRRGDWTVQCVAELIRAVYWFNPLTWIACARMRRESDHATDDAVLGRGVDPSEYASHLVDIAHALRQRRAFAPALAMAHTTGFERRVHAMLDHEINRRPLSTLVVAIVLIASIGIALPVVAITAAEQAVATFSGQVLDPQNGLLPGTTITLVNTQTQVKYEVKTNRDGRFEIPGVVPGPYVLESKLPGFQTLKWEVTINGQNVDRELRLELGTLQETITLRAGNGWPPSSPSQPTDPARIEAVKKKYAEQEANCASRPATAGPQIGGNIRTPVKLRDVRPVYPAALVADGVAGKAVLNTTIGPDGLVREVSVVSATRPEFADALSDAVRQWQFSSTLLNCTAMEVKMVVTGNFEYR